MIVLSKNWPKLPKHMPSSDGKPSTVENATILTVNIQNYSWSEVVLKKCAVLCAGDELRPFFNVNFVYIYIYIDCLVDTLSV